MEDNKMSDERGFFGIGIYQGKNMKNLGTLWRSAHILGASYMFTIGRRYQKQASDTTKAWKHVPLFQYDDLAAFKTALPRETQIVGVELDESSVPLNGFKHPERACYLLGAEDNGLSREAIGICHHIVQIPGDMCLNVAVAGSIAMYDRVRGGA